MGSGESGEPFGQIWASGRGLGGDLGHNYTNKRLKDDRMV